MNDIIPSENILLVIKIRKGLTYIYDFPKKKNLTIELINEDFPESLDELNMIFLNANEVRTLTLIMNNECYNNKNQYNIDGSFFA